MTKALAIIKPILPVAFGAAFLGEPDNLKTPNPKEIATTTAGAGVYTWWFDMGAVVDADSFFVGYISGRSDMTASVYTATSIAGAGSVFRANLTIGADTAVFRHAFGQFVTASSRYWGLVITASSTPTTLGALAVGKAFSPFWGHEMGAGRLIEDTSSVERLFGGGFGINEGAIVGGYQWTFGDLTIAERDALYLLALRLGISRTVLVVEDPEISAGLNERLHWGLFDRLEPYERINPADTRWSFRIKDWG